MAAKYWDGNQWIDLAGGQQGPPGPQGPQGPAGPQGIQGLPGVDGRGVESIELVSGTHAPGTFDTYRVTFSDETTQDFLVYNGADGQGSPGSQIPQINGGAGSAGTASAYSREDHKHPNNWELIWYNSSPDSSFPAQQIAHDMTPFKAIIVLFKAASSVATRGVAFFLKPDDYAPAGYNGNISISYISGSAYRAYWRNFRYTDASIIFETGHYNATEGTGLCIPLEIFGIR